MQVCLGTLEHRVVGRAVLAAATLPALALVADHPGRHYVLPFDAAGAVGVLARLVATALQIDAIPFVLAAAVEGRLVAGIQLPGDLLGFLEGAGRLDVGGQGGAAQEEQGGEQGKRAKQIHENILVGVTAVEEGGGSVQVTRRNSLQRLT
ncbi:hypothetical protein D3C81_1713550 [compost metagenome]